MLQESTLKNVRLNQFRPSDEDVFWNLRLLGEHSPQVLLDTMVYLIGLYSAIRSGNEHRRLHHYPSQLQLVEPPDGRAYIIYREDVSKTNQGGLNSRRKRPRRYCIMLTLQTKKGALFAYTKYTILDALLIGLTIHSI